MKMLYVFVTLISLCFNVLMPVGGMNELQHTIACYVVTHVV